MSGSGCGGDANNGSATNGGGENGSGGEIGKALDFNANAGQGTGYQYDGTLNLANDPSAKAALVQMLSSGQGVQMLMQQMNAQGTQRVQPYTVSKSQNQTGLELEVLDIGGGAQAGTSTQSQGFSPGTIRPPGQPWEKVVCQK